MDLLAGLLGSQLRADVLAALLLSARRSWRLSEVARAVDRQPQNIRRELEWLASLGLLSVGLLDGKPTYALEPGPLMNALGSLVRQARGPTPDVRRALERLTLPVIAWSTRLGSSTVARGASEESSQDLIVLSSAPRSLVQLQLVNVLPPHTRLYAMSVAEWMARLQKGEVVARRARRARKLWVVGSWSDLVVAERRHLEMKHSVAAARADWREELSDEWDEDFDPSDAKAATP